MIRAIRARLLLQFGLSTLVTRAIMNSPKAVAFPPSPCSQLPSPRTLNDQMALSRPPSGQTKDLDGDELLKRAPSTVFTKDDAQHLIESVRRITRRNTMILRVAVIVLGLVGAGVFVFWEDIKPFLGAQTAEVATLTLEDEVVQVKVGEFAKELLSQLLSHYSNDPETRRLTVDFARAILTDPSTSAATRELVNSILEDPLVRAHVNRLAKDTTVWVLNDPYVNRQVVELLQRISTWPETHQLLTGLTAGVINDPHTWRQLVDLTQRTLAAEQVQSQANQVAAGSVHWVLSDEQIQQRAQKFIEDTLSNERVKETAGYAMWDAIKIAFTPSLFRSRTYRPEKRRTIAEVDVAPGAVMAADKTLSVPDDKLQGAAEILFREAYEGVAAKFGLTVTPQTLNSKKREFEQELALRRSMLAPALRRAFTELATEYQEAVFQQDQQLIDSGGEEALLLRGRAKIDSRIALINDYLSSMEKQSKGYVWSSFTEEQEQERRRLIDRVAHLQREKADERRLIEQELADIMQRNPIAHFRSGSLSEFVGIKALQPVAPALGPDHAQAQTAPSSSSSAPSPPAPSQPEEATAFIASPSPGHDSPIDASNNDTN